MTKNIKFELNPESYIESIADICSSKINKCFQSDIQTAINIAGYEGIQPIEYISEYTSCGDIGIDFNRIIGWITWFTQYTMKAIPTEIIEKYGEQKLYYTIFETAFEIYKDSEGIY